MDGMSPMTKEDLAHFLTIVDDLSGAGKTIEEAKVRLRDEGLTEAECDLVIRSYMETYGRKS